MYLKLYSIILICITCFSCMQKMTEDDYAQFIEAKKLYADKKIDESLHIFEMLKNDKDFTNASFMAGKIYFIKNDYVNARKCFETALKQDNRNINAMYWLTILENEEGHNADYILSQLDTLLMLDNGHIGARLAKADILERQGKIEEAISECSIATAESKTLGLVHFKLGLIYHKAGMNKRAENEFYKALVLRDNDPDIKAFVKKLDEKDW